MPPWPRTNGIGIPKPRGAGVHFRLVRPLRVSQCARLMTPLPPAENVPQQPAPPAGADEFAADVQSFWEKNRSRIVGLCVAALVGILAWEGWKYVRYRQEQAVRSEYALLGTDSAKLTRFAEENSGHALAGVAHLTVADEAYAKGDFKAAVAAYQKAVTRLEHAALKSRAQLGAAMSQFASGDKAGAETALKAIAADTSANATARAEANYHLAVIAREAGRRDEAIKYVEEISKIEATGLWAQRAFTLRAQLEVATPPKPEDTGFQFKTGK
jgi:predicted negative regulator of RcsB-dependent stress response